MKELTSVACLFAIALLAGCGDRKPPAAPAPVVVVDPCAIETTLLARGKLLAGASPQDAVDILEPCRSTLSPEGLSFLTQVTADAQARKVKILAAEKVTQVKNQKVRAEIAKHEKAERRLHGVTIGMTREEVLDSSWGKPRSKNRTTGSYGTLEQWVYGDGNYLYFENGVVSTIQN